MTAQISLHIIVDNATEEQLGLALFYLQRTNQRMVTIAAGAQLDRGMLYVERVRKVLPAIKIFWRHLEDTGIWTRLAPPAWWITRVERFPATLEWAKRNQIIFVTDNESSGDDEAIKRYVEWQVAILKLLHSQGLHAAVGRFATGNIREEQYKLLKPMFEAMNEGDYYSPNEYFNAPGKSSGGHLNRYKLAWEAAGKPLPTAIGEFGLADDYKSDKGYLSIGMSGKAVAAEGIKHFEAWYKPNDVTVFWYCVGGYNWPHFQINEELYAALEEYASRPPVSLPELPPAKPAPMPKPTIAGAGKDIRIIKEADVRTGYNSGYPSVDTTPAAALQPNDTATLYTQTGRTDSNKGMTWAWVEIKSGLNAGKAGWVCTDWLEYEKITPPIQLPPKDDPTLGGLIKPAESDMVELRIVFRVPRELANKIQLSANFEIVEIVTKEIA